MLFRAKLMCDSALHLRLPNRNLPHCPLLPEHRGSHHTRGLLGSQLGHSQCIHPSGPRPKQPTHPIDDLLIATRTLGNRGGWGGLMGMRRLRGKGSCLDRDLVGLALQQDGSAKDCGIHNQRIAPGDPRSTYQRTWEPLPQPDHHPTLLPPQIMGHASPNYGQRQEREGPRRWRPQVLGL